MSRLPQLLAAALVACSSLPIQAAVPLRGVIRDFCAPGTDSCTQLPDFEGVIGDVVTGMVAPRLSNGLPAPGPRLQDGGATAESFAKWYTDAPGYNRRLPYTLSLQETAPGRLGFSDYSFYPIDGRGFGNQDRIHNYHFTMHVAGRISFDDPTSTADRLFTVSADDDLWVFVDGKLVVDLGGVHGAFSRSFDEEGLKRLGLVADKDYALDLFFAERHTVDSVLDLQTTFNIAPAVPEPASWLLLSAGLGGLAWRRRARARQGAA